MKKLKKIVAASMAMVIGLTTINAEVLDAWASPVSGSEVSIEVATDSDSVTEETTEITTEEITETEQTTEETTEVTTAETTEEVTEKEELNTAEKIEKGKIKYAKLGKVEKVSLIKDLIRDYNTWFANLSDEQVFEYFGLVRFDFENEMYALLVKINSDENLCSVREKKYIKKFL